jgi:hypothetical protein
MTRKTVADLTADELRRFALDAFAEPARYATAAGQVVSGFSDGSVVTGLEEARYGAASVARSAIRGPRRRVVDTKRLRRARLREAVAG